MVRPHVLAVALALSVGLGVPSAQAGCPSTCDIEATPAVVEPELACLTVTARGTSCDCDIELKLNNACEEPLDLIDFELTSCTVEGSVSRQQDCVTLGAGQQGILFLKIHSNGYKEYAFMLNSAGTDHSISVEARVQNYDGHPGCNLGSPPGTSSNHGRCYLLALVIAGLVRRKRGTIQPKAVVGRASVSR